MNEEKINAQEHCEVCHEDYSESHDCSGGGEFLIATCARCGRYCPHCGEKL